MKSKSKFLIIGINFLVYFILVYAIFGKAISHLNSYYIGIEGDSSYYIWITKWFSGFWHVPDPFHVTNVFYPIGIDISAGWEGSILFYVGGLLNSFLTPQASYNMLILIPFFLNWIAVYFVFHKYSSRLFLSGLFSTFFCLSSFFIVRTFGHPSYLYFFHIPLLFYFLRNEELEKITYKRASVVILVFVLISITSWYYFIFSALIAAVFLAAFILEKRRESLKVYKKILFVILGVALLVPLVNFPMFRAFFRGSNYFYPYPFKMNNEPLNKELSLRIVDYFKPSGTNNLFTSTDFNTGNIEKTLYPGTSFFIFISLSLFYIIRKRQLSKLAPVSIIALIFALISFGYNYSLPFYRFLTSFPIVSTLHAPARFGIIVVFSGWLAVAWGSRYFKQSSLAFYLVTLLCLSQIYEISRFAVPFESNKRLSVLEEIDKNSDSPILELPIRPGQSNTLLVPAFTGRPVFSGYPQHTTYSPQLTQITGNNVFIKLDAESQISPDITEKLTPYEFALYFRLKYDLRDIVVNKKFPLVQGEKDLLHFASLKKENDAYGVYHLDEPSPMNEEEGIKFITGRGVGNIVSGRRSLGESSEIDILSTYKAEKMIRVSADIIALDPNHSFSLNGSDKTETEMIVKPGLSSLTIRSNGKCAISGADCITGFITGIYFRLN